MSGDAEAALGWVAGRYRLEAELGRGGTATVYQAWDTRLQVGRAVKVLTVTSRRLRLELQRRLEREAQTMAALNNPHLLRIYDIGEEEGRDYIVMELAEGGSLHDWLDAHGPMAPATAIAFTLHLLSALDAAHSAGIIHRDVKPQNILLNAQGCALLADFGIALWDREDVARHTQAGTLMGSLAFMAPEQRQDASTVGPAADIYAAGATLYTLLTESLPLDLFLAPAHSARWAKVHPLLQPIIARATRPLPEERYPSARAFAQALAAALGLFPPEPGAHDIGLRPSPQATASILRHLDEAHAHEDALLILRPLLLPTSDPPSTEPSGYTPTALAAEAPSPHPTLIAEEDQARVAIIPGTQPTVAVPTAASASPSPAPLPRRLGMVASVALVLLLIAAVAVGVRTDPGPPMLFVASRQGLVAAPTAPRLPPLPTSALAALAETIQVPSASPAVARPAAAVGSSVVSGKWRGAFDGRSASLQLWGTAESLSGTVTVTFLDRVQEQRVRGRYDVVSRTLRLEDVDTTTSSAGHYTATLSEDNAVLSGVLEQSAGGAQRQARMQLRRSP